MDQPPPISRPGGPRRTETPPAPQQRKTIWQMSREKQSRVVSTRSCPGSVVLFLGGLDSPLDFVGQNRPRRLERLCLAARITHTRSTLGLKGAGEPKKKAVRRGAKRRVHSPHPDQDEQNLVYFHGGAKGKKLPAARNSEEVCEQGGALAKQTPLWHSPPKGKTTSTMKHTPTTGKEKKGQQPQACRTRSSEANEPTKPDSESVLQQSREF